MLHPQGRGPLCELFASYPQAYVLAVSGKAYVWRGRAAAPSENDLSHPASGELDAIQGGG
jgi:hypothetical protein